MRPPFSWRDMTDRDVKAAVRAQVGPQPYDEPFTSDLLSDLIRETHFYCSVCRLRPDQFKKTHDDTPYALFAHFDRGWRQLSWRKCFEPPSRAHVLKRSLRRQSWRCKDEYLAGHPVCEKCGHVPACEAHFVELPFAELCRRFCAGLAERDYRDALAAWDWFKDEEFSLAPGLKVTRDFDKVLEHARLVAVCASCRQTLPNMRTLPDMRRLPTARRPG